ncbi:hypothetical protein SALBM217S_03813 [Streptomyces griseoloalbus]
MDLLVDDSDGVVLGALRIPPLGRTARLREAGGDGGRPWLRTCRSLVRTLVQRPGRRGRPTRPGQGRPGCGWRSTGRRWSTWGSRWRASR